MVPALLFIAFQEHGSHRIVNGFHSAVRCFSCQRVRVQVSYGPPLIPRACCLQWTLFLSGKCDIPTLFPTFGRDFRVNKGYCLSLMNMIKRETLRARKILNLGKGEENNQLQLLGSTPYFITPTVPPVLTTYSHHFL